MRGIVMEKRGVVFKFEGEVEEISVETFTQAVLGYAQLVQATAQEVDPNMRVDVRISAIRPGCIEAVMSAIATDLPGLLAGAVGVAGSLGTVFATVKGYLELRKFLGKNGAPTEIKKADGGENLVMTQNGGSMTVNNYVLNVDGSEAAAKAAASLFTTLVRNDDVEGVSIIDEERPTAKHFAATRDEFDPIIDAPKCAVDSTRVSVREHQALAVSKAVLEAQRTRKWEFFWNGVKISGSIIDEEFFDRLTAHVWTFGIGDCIDADLEVTQKLNALGIWENSRYRVVKVHDVFRTPQNERLLREE